MDPMAMTPVYDPVTGTYTEMPMPDPAMTPGYDPVTGITLMRQILQ